MLSLSMIVKASDDEAKLLDRCLKYLKGNVDEINITITGKNEECEKVCKKYGAKVSHYEWKNDFAKARNYNFSQASGDYIFWCDADDIVKGAENLRGIVEKMKEETIDCVSMNYLYDFDENGECTVKHTKTRLIKKGSVKWIGKLHEDLTSSREVTTFFAPDVEVMHLTDNKRAFSSAKRNLEIAQEAYKENKKDPRNVWLVANAHTALGENEKAIKYFEEFVKTSQSDEEKYIAYLTLFSLDRKKKHIFSALELRPTYPNAYFLLAEKLEEEGKYESAISFVEIGLQLPKPEQEMIVFNPRDYDYNPLMLLVRIYWKLGRYSKAKTILDKMSEMFPKDKQVKEKLGVIQNALQEAGNAEMYLKKAKKIKDKKELKKYFDSLPQEVQSHPSICSFRNSKFIKETSSGKDLVFYCSYTEKEWIPKTAEEKGIGGSEESIIHTARGLANLGWNVTVYNNCGKNAGMYEGVRYEPFWKYNVRDKQDVTIFWRHPKPIDYRPNSTKVIVDLHDVIPKEEFFEERLEHIDKIFVKTQAHRSLFPNVPNEKFAIIPNGIDPKQFDKVVRKNPYLILNTSSPDRHLEATLDVFEELLKKNPDKPWRLAWYYGWDVFDSVHEKNEEVMAWKRKQLERFEKLKKQGKAEGGMMISHKEIANKYLEAGVFLYPTRFYEIHCISAVKAQAANCKCVTSDYAALNETVMVGTKIHEDVKKMGQTIPELQGKEINKYVEAIISAKEQDSYPLAISTYNWGKIIKQWNYEISNC